MSAAWSCRVDTAIDLQRPSRRAFDRLRECVIRTSATAPIEECDSDPESIGSADEFEVGFEPTYTRNVIIEIQSRNEVWQTQPFNVMGRGVQCVHEEFTIPAPEPGAVLHVRALRLHRIQSHALIGEAEINQVHGATTVTLKRKGRPKGVVSLCIVDHNAPAASATSTPSAVPRSTANNTDATPKSNSPVADGAVASISQILIANAEPTSPTPTVAEPVALTSGASVVDVMCKPKTIAADKELTSQVAKSSEGVETDGECDPSVALLRPKDGPISRDASLFDEGGEFSIDKFKRHRHPLLFVLFVFVLSLLLVYAIFGGIDRQELVAPRGTEGPESVRQFMRSDELQELMADNIMTIGHQWLKPEDRQDVMDEVARHVKAFDETLDKDDPVTAAEMDKLRVTEDTREDVLKTMSAISDNRLVRLTNEVQDAMHDAAIFSLSREAFKISLAQTLEPKMGEMQELKLEFFPREAAANENTGAEGHFHAFFDSLENTKLIKAFDAWKGKGDEKIAMKEKELEGEITREETQIIKDTESVAKKEVQDVTEEERKAELAEEAKEALGGNGAKHRTPFFPRRLAEDLTAGGVNIQLEEFMSEIKSSFGDAFRKPDKSLDDWQRPRKFVGDTYSDTGGAGSGGGNGHVSEGGAYPFGGDGYPSEGGGSAGQEIESRPHHGIGMMECAVQIIGMNPEGFIVCSMQAMMYVMDMMRSMPLH